MYSLKLGTGTAVVITDRRLIKELIDKKSSKYSNRPPSYISHDLMTKGDHLLVMQYGPLWRTFRKLIHQYFMESVVEKEHITLQNAEAVQMVRDFCLHPEQHMLHPKRYSNSIIMSLGMRIISTHFYCPVANYPDSFWNPDSICGHGTHDQALVRPSVHILCSSLLTFITAT